MDPIGPGFRMQALAAADGLLRLMRGASDRYGDLDSFVAYLVVLVANAESVARDPVLAARYGGTEPIPAELLRPVTRLAVAYSSGLSRETTRRKLAKLVADGHLIEEAGGLRPPATVMSERANLQYANLMVREFLRTAERIQCIGQEAGAPSLA